MNHNKNYLLKCLEENNTVQFVIPLGHMVNSKRISDIIIVKKTVLIMCYAFNFT